MQSKTSIFIFIVIVLLDFITSFFCYLQNPLWGDLSNIVLPTKSCEYILTDPLGYRVLATGEEYISPNRFFAHWIPYVYFNNIIFFLQNFVSPIDSIYIACALVKSFIHIGISIILTYWVVGSLSVFKSHFVVIFAFISSLILASPSGYLFPLRIIDESIVYTFAYAFSFLFVLLYMHPFVCIYQGFREAKIYWWEHIILFLLSFIVVFHGPINGPSTIQFSGLALSVLCLQQIKQNPSSTLFYSIQQIPKIYLFHFTWIILLGLYSFYLGRYNAENPAEIPSLAARYLLLLKGIFGAFFRVLATPVPLIGLTILFYYFANKLNPSEDSKKFITNAKYIIIFSTIYTFLLPLGGYRTYRHYIFRFDTMLPISLGIFLLLAMSLYLLIKALKGKEAIKFSIFLAVFLSSVVGIDAISLYFPNNTCEREALVQLSKATEEPVLVPNCNIMSWEPPTYTVSPSDQSNLLHKWKVTSKPLIFYHKK